MAGDARALLGNRLFRDLDQDLLPFFQQVGDQRLRAVPLCANVVAASAETALAATAIEIASPAWLALLISSGRRRRPQFRATVPWLLAFLFFVLEVSIAADQAGLAALFGGNHFVLIDIRNLGNPPVRVIVVVVERLFLQLEVEIAGHFAQRLQVLRHGMEFHLIVFERFVLQRATRRRLRWRGVMLRAGLESVRRFSLRVFQLGFLTFGGGRFARDLNASEFGRFLAIKGGRSCNMGFLLHLGVRLVAHYFHRRNIETHSTAGMFRFRLLRRNLVHRSGRFRLHLRSRDNFFFHNFVNFLFHSRGWLSRRERSLPPVRGPRPLRPPSSLRPFLRLRPRVVELAPGCGTSKSTRPAAQSVRTAAAVQDAFPAQPLPLQVRPQVQQLPCEPRWAADALHDPHGVRRGGGGHASGVPLRLHLARQR